MKKKLLKIKKMSNLDLSKIKGGDDTFTVRKAMKEMQSGVARNFL